MELDNEKLEIIKDFFYKEHYYITDEESKEEYYKGVARGMRILGYSLDEIEAEIKEEKIIDKKSSREYLNRSLYEMIQMYKEQGDDADKSIFYEKQYQNLDEGIKEIHNKAVLRLNEKIKTCGLKKLIKEVGAEIFFDNDYRRHYNKETFIIEELDLVPRLLKLHGNCPTIHMVRDENYKTLFKIISYDYDMLEYYKICSLLYPNKVPKIPDALFNRLIEIEKEIIKNKFEKMKG